MKPDRILLAELRGDEAWEFIKSVNTGHPGSISTMHANGAFEAFEQLTALIKDSRTGAHLDTAYIKNRLYTTLDIILFYHKRKLRELYYDPEFKRKQMNEGQGNQEHIKDHSKVVAKSSLTERIVQHFNGGRRQTDRID
ncbi:MAG: ATPase, T2SS/T4P/T4SS family, partial [Sulfuriferula sp.]